jgi:hypothetical protein
MAAGASTQRCFGERPSSPQGKTGYSEPLCVWQLCYNRHLSDSSDALLLLMARPTLNHVASFEVADVHNGSCD